MAAVQPNTGATGGIPPTAVPAPPLSQLNPGSGGGIVSAGFNANDPDMGHTMNYNNTAGGDITVNGGVATRSVDPNALTSNQLAGLENTNSPLSQLALAQGANNAAATGNANGTLMAGASENALLQQLTPIASQNAQVYERQAQSNQDALNTAANTDRSVHGQIAAAGVSANASMHNAQLAADTAAKSLAQNQQQFTTNWQNEFQTAKNSQAFQTASQAQQQQFSLQSNGLNSAMNTIFSDPSYWSNPQGAMGMLNYFGSNINSLVDSLFPQQGGATNQMYSQYGYTPTQANANIPNTGAP